MKIHREASPSHSIENAPQDNGLDVLAQRIKERDRLAMRYAQAQWLENGRDLLKAKEILGHGNFEAWCERALSYTSRTAEKLMRAAEVWGPILENESGSVMPRLTIVYALSAPSVPKNIRDVYVPRVLAGEEILTELRESIQHYRTTAKEATVSKAHLIENLPKVRHLRVVCSMSGAEGHHVKRERQASARTAALALIYSRFCQDLPVLLALTADAGSGSVFSLEAERELLEKFEMATLVEERVDVLVTENNANITEMLPASVMPDDHPPSSSVPMITVKAEEFGGPIASLANSPA